MNPSSTLLKCAGPVSTIAFANLSADGSSSNILVRGSPPSATYHVTVHCLHDTIINHLKPAIAEICYVRFV